MKIHACLIVALLCIGLMFGFGSLAATVESGEALEQPLQDQSFDRLRHFTVNDAVSGTEEFYGQTAVPEHDPLEIHASDVPGFERMAVSPYYKVFFSGTTVRMCIGSTWIAFELSEQQLGTIKNVNPVVDKNSLSVSDVFESVDLQYTVETSVLTETLILKEVKEFEQLIQKISWGGMTPEYEEDGSILFSDENGKEILKILPPFMKDATGVECEDLYYGLKETETGYELHKIINEEGLEWLEKAVYPVVIDPIIETVEDWWQSSGLKLSFQFFKNLNEYVNPGNGHQLTHN